ncbi:DUF7882 family protein [Leucobacter japonicus]|uniref:DUF7882 family protein n=1 Tax=Leucobacter japonicus TaxID=1461259 RepID=UPI0006A7E1F6|nr:hypothetical protein [Leucobacter japonicus]
MGYMLHGGREYEFEDRTLAHLKTVIGMKLAKGDSFFLSWSLGMHQGSGRHEVWISEYAPVAFRFSGSKLPQLNPEWIKALLAVSHTSRGLVVLSEQDASKWVQRNPLLAA